MFSFLTFNFKLLSTSETAQSSTYIYKDNSLGRSLTIKRKNRGPSLVPCGTPAFISFQSDLQVFLALTKTQPRTQALRRGTRAGARKSSWGTRLGLEVFHNGRTSAHFHSPVTWPSLIELNMEHTGMLIIVAQFFKSQLGISSGSTDLRSCRATKATSTASRVIVYSSVMLETGMGVKFQFRYVVSSTAK